MTNNKMIKYAGFDVYGTIIAYTSSKSRVPALNFPARTGLEEILDRLERNKIMAITCSDVDSDIVREDLEKVFLLEPQRNLYLRRFLDFVCLNQMGCKDYDVLLDRFGLEPDELVIFDDVLENVQSARESKIPSSQVIHVPRYCVNENNWSFKNQLPFIS